jgi:nucleoside-diphosphate-sugar epimerase
METLKTPHLLVIGGTGFIGHHLLRASLQKDWQVSSVSLNPPTKGRFVDGVSYLHLDLTDRLSVKESLGEDFDYVVNLGGYINHQLFRDGGRKLIEMHFTALKNMLEVLSRRKLKRFVQIGSSDEYGNAPAPQHEEMREQPISPYSLAKTASTHFLQMLYRTENYPAVTLRLFLTYGPGQDGKRFIPQVINGCLHQSSFPTSEGKQIRDFCHVDDAVNAIILALLSDNSSGKIFNIGSGIPVTIKSVVNKITRIINKGVPDFGRVPCRQGENMNLYANIKHSQKVLNWSPQINFDTGIRGVIEWTKQNG